jgi:pantoate--beta-alanine ligase
LQIIKSIRELDNQLQQARRKGMKVALVPTMGFLHEGHLSLVRAANMENDLVVVSIFVNPTQFGPGEDYDTYPRDLENDVIKLQETGIEYIFAPDVEELYPEGYSTFVEVEGITDKLCGHFRPGHFRGVTTIVSKLFNIVRPDRAYFGEKDYQQLIVIKKMVRDLNMPVQIKGLPIIREEDGLAMSSRNRYLNSEERKAATVLYKALQNAKKMVYNGERDADQIKKEMLSFINKEPLVSIDYVSVVDPETLEDLDKIKDSVLLALAVYIGDTRLIDNVLIKCKDMEVW